MKMDQELKKKEAMYEELKVQLFERGGKSQKEVK